uniref:Uncharacterized protein n=2 Tax=Aegilops tauschii subsp. strangulata TaxID=200361 RepID=A0A453PAL8_AEGTS
NRNCRFEFLSVCMILLYHESIMVFHPIFLLQFNRRDQMPTLFGDSESTALTFSSPPPLFPSSLSQTLPIGIVKLALNLSPAITSRGNYQPCALQDGSSNNYAATTATNLYLVSVLC